MTTLLWVFVIASAINTLLLIFFISTGELPAQSPGALVIEAAFTLAIGALALWLLAKGGAA